MGTNFKDYLAASRAAESPEDAALRKVFAEHIRLGLQFRDVRVDRGLTQRQLRNCPASPRPTSAGSSTARGTLPRRPCSAWPERWTGGCNSSDRATRASAFPMRMAGLLRS